MPDTSVLPFTTENTLRVKDLLKADFPVHKGCSVAMVSTLLPNRHGDYAHALRKMVGESTLDELFFSCFAQGLVYVIQSGRYLYPTAISIYNHYAQLR